MNFRFTKSVVLFRTNRASILVDLVAFILLVDTYAKNQVDPEKNFASHAHTKFCIARTYKLNKRLNNKRKLCRMRNFFKN